MEFWTPSAVSTLIALGALFAVGRVVASRVPVPPAIVGGVVGLLVGPSALGLVPFDVSVLEAIVYHALALVFIALGLQGSKEQGRATDARSMALGISTMVALQTSVGLLLALALGVHTGFGLLLPLGFEQGPGQAMALGTAWEASGLQDGGKVGLIIAAIGFGWALFAGVPLAMMGERRTRTAASIEGVTTADRSGMGFSTLLSIIAVVYGATWAVCSVLASALSGLPEIAAMIWGFHFLIAALVATVTRRALGLAGATELDDVQLSQLSGTIVDGATVAALASVQLAVLSAWWVPIVAISGVGGLVTLAACVVLGRWGFKEAAFEHTLLWFGMSTGTLPVGLALLRIVDPDFQSPAPASALYGSALAVIGVAPIVLGLHPLAITGRPELALGLSVAWMVLMLALWGVTVRRRQRVTAA